MKLSCNRLHSSNKGTSEAMRSTLGLQLDDFNQRRKALRLSNDLKLPNKLKSLTTSIGFKIQKQKP